MTCKMQLQTNYLQFCVCPGCSANTKPRVCLVCANCERRIDIVPTIIRRLEVRSGWDFGQVSFVFCSFLAFDRKDEVVPAMAESYGRMGGLGFLEWKRIAELVSMWSINSGRIMELDTRVAATSEVSLSARTRPFRTKTPFPHEHAGPRSIPPLRQISTPPARLAPGV